MRSSRVGQVWRCGEFIWLIVRTLDENETNAQYVQYDALYLGATQDNWQIHDGYMKIMTEWGEGSWDAGWPMERIA